MIPTGETAPAFTLPDQDGNDVSLADFAGQTVVLYFYPKANTSGCTTQACGVRDHRDDYAAAGAVVLGVSPDPVKDVKKFHDEQGLNFTLLADEDHAVCEAYGTWQEKSMYGRKYCWLDTVDVRDRRRRRGPARDGQGQAGHARRRAAQPVELRKARREARRRTVTRLSLPGPGTRRPWDL